MESESRARSGIKREDPVEAIGVVSADDSVV